MDFTTSSIIIIIIIHIHARDTDLSIPCSRKECQRFNNANQPQQNCIQTFSRVEYWIDTKFSFHIIFSPLEKRRYVCVPLTISTIDAKNINVRRSEHVLVY